MILAGTVALLVAQAIPRLGAEAILGSGGVTVLAPQGALGALSNPALLATDRGWSAVLTFARAGAVDIGERAAAARWSSGRVGVGIRVASRAVDNLFEDPALAATGLEVRDAEASVGLGAEVRRVSGGVAATWFGSTVLGAQGSGVGLRAGLAATRGRLTAALSYGDQTAAMRWRSDGAPAPGTRGVTRLALGLGYAPRLGSSLPLRAAVEFDRDGGAVPATWLRGTLGAGLFQDHLRCFAGAGVEVSAASVPAAPEVGVTVNAAAFAVSLGYRFQTQTIPGNTLAISGLFGVGR